LGYIAEGYSERNFMYHSCRFNSEIPFW